MVRRVIGQERLALASAEPRGGTSLDEMAGLVDWSELDRLLAGISASAKGEAGWPPLCLFKALLLATWHELSDVKLARRWMTGPRSVAFAALPRASSFLSAPPSCASGGNWSGAGST